MTFRVFRVALFVLLASCQCGSEKAPIPVAALTRTGGEVTLRRATEPLRSALLEPLFVNDLLATGATGQAVVRADDGSEIELGPDTRFLIRARQAGVDLQLEDGAITMLTGERSGGVSLSLLTPYGELSVAPGAKARLNRTGGGLTLDLDEGSISLVTAEGKRPLASAGQTLRLAMGAIELVVDAGVPVPEPVVALDLPPIEVRLKAERGAPTVKRPGAPRFGPLSRADEPVSTGTAFQVPANAEARLHGE
ncbi:MAG: FecR domain-containing protein, partial [Archangium sp.]|nr:FecR domain-containing protein [Archangium sp.]